MNYYLTDPEILPKLTEGEILLTEPVLRPEDDGETVLRFLKDLGFETLFSPGAICQTGRNVLRAAGRSGWRRREGECDGGAQ